MPQVAHLEKENVRARTHQTRSVHYQLLVAAGVSCTDNLPDLGKGFTGNDYQGRQRSVWIPLPCIQQGLLVRHCSRRGRSCNQGPTTLCVSRYTGSWCCSSKRCA